MKRKSTVPPRLKGFTLLELMVGLVIFTIGIVGFSGMIMMQAQGTRTARTADEAATLVQSTIKDMTGICWDYLGNNSSLPAPSGLTNGTIRVEGPLNRNGEEIGGGSTGPYPYYRHAVVCKWGAVVGAGSPPYQYCGSGLASNRPPELSCPSTLLASNSEKMIRVLVNWTDKGGACHHKATDAMAFDWDGPGEPCD